MNIMCLIFPNEILLFSIFEQRKEVLYSFFTGAVPGSQLFGNFYSQPQKNCKRSSVEECIFDYTALHIECQFYKNTLLQCYSVMDLLIKSFFISLQLWVDILLSLLCFSVRCEPRKWWIWPVINLGWRNLWTGPFNRLQTIVWWKVSRDLKQKVVNLFILFY